MIQAKKITFCANGPAKFSQSRYNSVIKLDSVLPKKSQKDSNSTRVFTTKNSDLVKVLKSFSHLNWTSRVRKKPCLTFDFAWML